MDTKVFEKARKSSMFVSILGYKSADGSEGDYSLKFHVSYLRSVYEAKNALEAYLPTSEELEQFPDIMTARANLLASFNRTLEGKRVKDLDSDEVIKDPYVPVVGEDGKPIRGLKRHAASGEIHLWAMIRHKTVTKEAAKRESKPITANAYLRNRIGAGDFRQFKLTEGGQVRFSEIRIEGNQFKG